MERVLEKAKEELFRNQVLNERKRTDGRGFKEIRPIDVQVGLFHELMDQHCLRVVKLKRLIQ